MDTITIIDTLKFIDVSTINSINETLLKPDNTIAITAVVVSILALLITIFWNWKTFKATQKNTKLSNIPIIDSGISINAKDEDGNYYLECDLHNNGLGPGIIIDKVQYEYEEKRYNSLKEVINIAKVIESKLIIWNKSKFTIVEKFGLGAKEKYILFRITLMIKPENNPKYLDSVLIPLCDFLKKVNLVFDYKSIYDEEFPGKGPILSEDISMEILRGDY